MAMDLSAVTRAEMKIERLTQPDDITIEFISTDNSGARQVVLTLTQNNDWDIVEVNNIYVNVEFLRFRVKDFEGFDDILAKTEWIHYQGFDYRIRRRTPPFSVDRTWSFRLERNSEFANE